MSDFSEGTPPARVMIVDSHPLIRRAFKSVLDTADDLSVFGEAATASEGRALVMALKPDVVVVEIQLAEGHGLDFVRDVRAEFPEIKLMVLSAFDEVWYADRARRAGAAAYVCKRDEPSTILAALRALVAGKSHFARPREETKPASAAHGSSPVRDAKVHRLSDRELQVFQLIGRGHSTVEIANQLQLSPHTIESHRENMKRKLQIRHGTELMHRAMLWVMDNS